MGVFSIWRHHLDNEAHRRYIANNPTPHERARALHKAEIARLGPSTGVRSPDDAQWDAFVALWLPEVREHREMTRLLYRRELASDTYTPDTHARARAGLDRLEKPITWTELVALARSRGVKAIRPPRHVEKALRTGACSLDGPVTTAP
jgi:hypothetical protein